MYNTLIHSMTSNRSIKILIDEGMSSVGKPTGIGMQAINLYLHLSKFCQCDISDYNKMKIFPKGIRKVAIDILMNINQIFYKYDLIHYQNNYLPFTKGKSKKVVTIHDLGAFLFPDTVPFIYLKYNQHSIKKALVRAEGIITPSESIKNEILHLFPHIGAEKIFICCDGIRDLFWNPISNEEDIFKKLGLKKYSYFFFLGSLSRRKNLRFALESFIKAKDENKISKDTLFVLGGQQWWGAWEFKHLLKKEYGILSLGYLKDEEIAILYKFSKAFVFPSLYEGFGMPIIEAMSQNTPIIASNIPTSVELNTLHNKQMFFFDLNNRQQFISQIEYLENEFFNVRKNLNYGDLSKYHFDNVAKRHLEVYSKILCRN